MKSNIFLTGFSGSGKTTVGQEVARSLGWRFVDTDEEIVRSAGKPIESIIDDVGEARFRQEEHRILLELCKGECQVVSTGGGMVVDEGNRILMGQNGGIICLEAQPETLEKRLVTQSGPIRPLLISDDHLGRIRLLKAERQNYYALAHWTVHTDRLTLDEVSEEIVRAWKVLGKQAVCDDKIEEDLASVVRTSSGEYPIWVGWDILQELGRRVIQHLRTPVAFIIGDDGVRQHVERAQRALEDVGIPTYTIFIPTGEKNKTLDTVQRVYSWLAGHRAERGHLVVAVGGGMVGDLAGFVAATFLRGMSFVQVPTTTLAMMDAAVGGKVAVDMPEGKNLVGAFHQPKFVLADVSTLQTLSQRELISGWAEALKHGLIMDNSLLSIFERKKDAIQALDPRAVIDVIRRSVAIKANIVSKDEKETRGFRILLNYGHTIGHAIEAATGYRQLLHGEAVSVGMMGAACISHAMGMISKNELLRQRDLLQGFGLPISFSDMNVPAVLEAMRSDKKTSDNTIRWVLLEEIGKATTRNDVPEDLVRETLIRLSKPGLDSR